MSIKIGMVSLGCPKNQVDAELMLNKLSKDNNYEIVNDENKADVIIVNTCGFIEDAKKESIETILEFVQLKEQGKIKAVIATGCLAERYRDEMMKEIPELDGVVGIGCNGQIVEIVNKAVNIGHIACYGKKTDLPMEGGRMLTTLAHTAYLKIADGCDNCCTYCAIPMIRGPFRSRKIEDIVSEAKDLVSKGVKEIVLIAQDTTRYGLDIYNRLALPDLLTELCKINGIKCIRLLYCYPDFITDKLLDVIASNDKICRYMDIPLQHCNRDVLKAMNRRGDKQWLSNLIKKIRDKIPGITLRTTLITGFPGETDEQFNELCDFVNEMKFEHLGCFAYSAEENTIAAEMDNQIDEKIKQRRQEIIMEQQRDIALEHIKEYIGKTITVVAEYYDEDSFCWIGRSERDAPEIDGRVIFGSASPINTGDFVDVRIIDCIEYDLIGQHD